MMPHDQDQEIGMHERIWVRALWALPLLAVCVVFERTFTPTIYSIPSFTAAKETGILVLGNGEVASLCTKFFGLVGLDNFIANYVMFFTPSIGGFDQASRMQMIGFLGDLVPLQTIWMIEGVRRGNLNTVAYLLSTILNLAYQIKGIGFIAPIYFFLHYIQSPLRNYAAADNRMCQISAVKTLIPTLTLSYIIPGISMFIHPQLSTRQWINGLLWQPFPIYAALLQQLFRIFATDTDSTPTNPEADLPHLRRAYAFSALVSASAYLYIRTTSPFSMREVFFQNLTNPTAAVTLIQGTSKALRYDQITCFSAGAIWTMLAFKDLKTARKVDAGWARILGSFVVATVVVGPGAAMATMWAWREECLAKRRVVVLAEKKG